MKKYLFLMIFCMLNSLNIFADYNKKLSFEANSFFSIYKYAKESNFNKSNLFQNSNDLVKLYLKVTSDYNQSEIEKLGGIVSVKTKSIAVVQIPIEKVNDLSKYDFVEKIDIVKKPQFYLDKALPKSNVDKVHNGTGLKSSYTGKGVIVGVGDIGFDFTHKMFSDVNDIPRIKRAWLTSVDGIPPAGMNMGHLYADSSQIKNEVKYSSNTQAHGAHVLGIAAGTPVEAIKGTYSGVAKDADIIVVGIENTSGVTELIEATAYMFKYADSVNKPISINYSFGYLTNTHACDGDGLIEIAMSELLQENPKGKIVSISAGNNGTNKIHSKIELKNNDSCFVNIPFSATYQLMPNVNARLLTLDIWGEEDKPFTADFYYKKGNQEIKVASYNTDNPDYIQKYMQIPSINKQYMEVVNVTSLFGEQLYSNNKSNINFQLIDFQYDQVPDSIYVIIKGSNTTINIWNNSGTDYHQPMSANFVPDNNSTITSPGVVEEVITVGAYISRTGGPYHAENFGDIDDIANFSSKGPLSNGKIKPDVTAPGAELVSAKNKFSNIYDNFIYDTTTNNSDYFISISGTSMASPLVCGIVALMLEKKPDLTAAEAKEIIRITAINDSYTGNCKDNKSPIWGWGKIDAQAIMAYLEETSIDENLNMDLSIFPNPATNYINIVFDNPQNGNVKIEILTSAGEIISNHLNEYRTEGIQSFTINGMNLTSGAYFVKMTTNNSYQIKSFIVK